MMYLILVKEVFESNLILVRQKEQDFYNLIQILPVTL